MLKERRVTDPTDEKPDEKANSDSTGSDAENPRDGDSVGMSDPPELSRSVSETHTPTEELPDEEELTPELVEEEAIRGDFMLRWAAIFLAVLFGFSYMGDSRTLVHVRSGEQMRDGGLLPQGTDAMSFVLEGRPITNVSWLFDHAVSAVYSAGEARGLSVFKALLAAVIAYVLSRISVPGLPTWWSSICGVLAIAAASSDLIPITDLATLVGMVFLLRLLHWHREGQSSGLIWKIPLLIAVWANFDPRAYLGVVAVVLYAIGHELVRGREDATPQSSGSLLPVGGLAAAALLVNPFPLASLTSVWRIYTVDFPSLQTLYPLTTTSAMRLDGRTEYYSLLNSDVFQGFELAYVAGLAMLLIGLIVLAISRDRREVPWLVTLIGFGALAIFRLHDLAPAALVAAVVASTVAQRWYRRTFPQEYTIDPREVLFSRGGRAATVFAFAALAFLIAADRLPTRSAIGLGFEPDLATTMKSLSLQFESLPDDARILHTRPEQGDLLIWNGRQSLVDSRITPFGSTNNPDSPMARYVALLGGMLRPPAGVATAADTASPVGNASNDWIPQFEEWQLKYAMPRLAPPGLPDYESLARLRLDPRWALLKLNGSGALFEYIGSQAASADPEEFDERSLSIADVAFRDASPIEASRIDFAQEPDFYKKYVYRLRDDRPAPLRAAQHYLQLMSMGPRSLEEALAFPTLAIRGAGEALFLDSQDAEAYKLLGVAYARLSQVEQNLAQMLVARAPVELRYFEAVAALRQAALLRPTDPAVWIELYVQFEQQNRFDLAAECLEKYLTLTEDQLVLDPQVEVQREQHYERLSLLKEQIESFTSQVEDALLKQKFPDDPNEHGAAKLEIAQQMSMQGYVVASLNLMRDSADVLRSMPEASVLRGQLLLETGKLDEAHLTLAQVAGFAREDADRYASIPWYLPVAASNIAKGNYIDAVGAWADQARQLRYFVDNQQTNQMLIASFPLMTDLLADASDRSPVWPLNQLQHCPIPLQAVPRSQAEPRFMMALAHMEAANLDNARVLLQSIISDCGDSEFRGLAIVYLDLLSEDAEQLVQESTLDQWEAWTLEGPVEEPAGGEAGTEDSETAKSDSGQTAADENSAEPPAVSDPPTAPAATETPVPSTDNAAPPEQSADDAAAADDEAADDEAADDTAAADEASKPDGVDQNDSSADSNADESATNSKDDA